MPAHDRVEIEQLDPEDVERRKAELRERNDGGTDA